MLEPSTKFVKTVRVLRSLYGRLMEILAVEERKFPEWLEDQMRRYIKKHRKKMEITKEQIVKIAKHLIKETRILNQAPVLSFPDDPNTKVKADIPKSLILLVGVWEGDGQDLDVATKGLSYEISKALETSFTQSDFRDI